jgi:two-component system response regulator NreC
MNPIRVLLAEDHTMVRKGLRALLDNEEDIEVVGEAEDGRQAIQMTQKLRPEVVVMDISMPRLNGLEATRQIHKLMPEVKVLILTMHTNEEYVFQILKAKAKGYVGKQSAPEELIRAIRAIHQGKTYLSVAVSQVVVEEYLQRVEDSRQKDPFNKLTTREREVLQLIAEGYSTKDIAQQLFISVKTVETHRAHLMEKLGLHSTVELTRYAIRRGLTSPEQFC